MNNLIIEPTKYTPEILFNCEKNFLEIKGKSYPEDTSLFYKPIFSWVEKYLETIDTQDVTVNIDLIYFNSSSSKILMDFLDILEAGASEGKKITVNWMYEKDDEDALEFGEEFEEDLEAVKFNLVERS